MLIIPVLYLLDGRCVALYKGSFEQKEEYFKHPADMARTFERDGAPLIYIVDLNARDSEGVVQEKLVEQVIHSIKIPVWLEANFKTVESLQKGLNSGAERLVVVSPPLEFFKKTLEVFEPARLIVQILGKQSIVVETFEQPTVEPRPSYVETDVVDYAEKLVALGVQDLIYKDQWSEGTMIHPNYDEVDRLILTLGPKVNIYVSGGIGDLKHLQLLKKIGAAGALIGKSFYERNLDLSEAITV